MPRYPVPNRKHEEKQVFPVVDASEEVRQEMIRKYGLTPKPTAEKPPVMDIPQGSAERSKRAAMSRKANARKKE